jgi:two-component system NtrC family sensor kinase
VWAVHDEAGRLECYEGIAEDITDRVRQDELLRRNERMACLGTTLAGVAHELNNPLAAILGFAQLLLRSPLDDASRAALTTIDHEATRAGRIVRDLLTLARKREAARHARVNLNDAVAYIVETRRYALETRRIAVHLQLDPSMPGVVGDRTQLEQVVLNLLNNAEQAIRSVREDGGRIAVATRRCEDAVVLEVEDDGPGVPAQARESIWDPFWTTKEPGSGTGLGLAVVHGIVASHGGVIDVERAFDDGGARFSVRLPAIAREELAEAPVWREKASTALDVLVVDSDVLESSFLTRFLTSRGHAALAANDLAQAFRLTEAMPFDAVICEARIAGTRETLHALRSTSGCAAARLVVAAAGPESTARLPLPLPPGTAVVMRPYDLEELRVLLED